MTLKFILIITMLFFMGCDKVKDSKPLTLMHNGINREYYVSLPKNVKTRFPLIIALHNFNGSAMFFKNLSELDEYALPKNVAVVYPEGINNSWNVGTSWDDNEYDDIGFIDVLIDSVASQFNIDLNRVYACGYSNGGYLTYELACNLSHKITAFGSVGGNFMLNENQTCAQRRKIPVIDFKGTADPFVAYDVAFDGDFSNDGSLLINENINFWSELNGFTNSSIEVINNINLTDSTSVEKHSYFDDDHNAKFIHYKIINGGHQWFGGKMGDEYISFIGLNSHDIHASELMVNFFLNYTLSNQ